MTKLWFVGMSGPGSLENLRELIDPIRHVFVGVVWVLHDAQDSDEAKYLESIKGEGKIIHIPFSRRHAFSRNHYLWCGPIQPGDWIVQCDTLERINPAFAANIPSLVSQVEAQGFNTVLYYNKAFVYQQDESLEFVGSPHEGLRRHDGRMKPVELSQHLPTESEVRYSVRNIKRDTPFSWVHHYAKYYIDYPFGSNHCLLGNCDRGDEMVIFRQREARRIAFREYMRSRNVPLTIEGVVEYWLNNPLDQEMRLHINNEKILNDLYRLTILKDTTVTDNHHWKDMKEIT